MGQSVIYASIWLSFAYYWLSLLLWPYSVAGWTLFRVLRSFAAICLAIHFAVALHVVHQWSHAAAWDETARRTESAIGIAVGVGVYFNYFLVLGWLLQSLWCWLMTWADWNASTWSKYGWEAFLVLMWFNATVVFGLGITPWISSFLWLILVLLGIYNRRTPTFRTE
jgi:hypothetical protein